MGSLQEQKVPEYLRGESQWETKENVELYEAASEGDYERLKRALENGANANYYSKKGEQLGVLHAAARIGSRSSSESAKELIDRGARVSAALITNRNEPIHEAAATGSEEVCRVLLEASPKCAESENAFGNTALHAATRSGTAEVVRLLLNEGADCNRQNHRGSTALHIACFLASTSDDGAEGVDPFVKIGAILLCNDELQMDTCDVNGYTPLHIAAQRGCNLLVKLLIDSGASLEAKTGVDSKGRGARTPLGMAKFGGNDATAGIIEEAMAQDICVRATKKLAQELLGD